MEGLRGPDKITSSTKHSSDSGKSLQLHEMTFPPFSDVFLPDDVFILAAVLVEACNCEWQHDCFVHKRRS